MKNCPFRFVFAAAVLGTAGACRTLGPQPADQRQSLALMTISTWSDSARLLAGRLIEEYGPPDQIQSSRLVWRDQHLFRKLAVWDEVPDAGPDDGAFILEQTVSYPVPPERRPALAAFSDAIRVAPDGSEFTVGSNSEGRGFLALNLAYEVIKGIKTPEQARRFERRTRRLSLAGKASPFMQGLLFLPRPWP